MSTKNLTLLELVEQFASEDECHEFLAELRWPKGIRCSECNSDSVSYLRKRRQYDCNACRKRFSVKAGTIFNDSHLPLRKWFLAVYIMCQSKKSVSAKQLQRMLGVAYKTSWYLCHRIREAMRDEDERPLTGIVEADETYLGGSRKGVGSGPHPEYQAVVMGAVSRDGKLRLRHVPDRTAPQIRDFIEKNVSPKAKALHTDAYRAYISAAKRVGLPHGRVNHSRGEWVNGQVHTNTIEGVFSLLDRSILGAYHKVSKKHLHRYLEEVEWRYNNRENPYLFRDTILELISCEPMEYRHLISQSA
jgi:transposase-like protein